VSYKKALKFKPENPDLALLIGVSKRKAGQREKGTEGLPEYPGFQARLVWFSYNLAEMDIEDGDLPRRRSISSRSISVSRKLPGNDQPRGYSP